VAELPDLSSLSTEPPAGPNELDRAHANGMRKASSLLKNRLTDPERVEETVTAVVTAYLLEWAEMYGVEASDAGNMTERTIIRIRQDTMQQIAGLLVPGA